MKRPALGVAFLLSIVCGTGLESRALEAVFPQALETRFIFRIDQLPGRIDGGEARFALDREGRPYLALGDLLIAIGHRDDFAHERYRVPGGANIDRLAWMRDGALLVISGSQLGVMTGERINPMLALPSASMRIEPASGDAFYLYGGDTPDQRRSLYLYRKGGQLLHLFRAPAAIGAVAGDGDVTFLAIEESIYILVLGEPLRFVYEAGEAVSGLAVAPPWGVFFGTAQSFGYVTESATGYAFIRGQGGEPRVHDEDLYLFLPDEGVVKASPVSSFEDLARLLIEGPPEETETPAPLELDFAPTDEGRSARERLTELEALLEQELITPEEFAEKRQQILDDL